MVFVERISSLLRSDGVAGVVTQHTIMTLPAYNELRRNILTQKAIRTVAHLGTGAFEAIGGANVNPILLVYGNTVPSDVSTSLFIRLVRSRDKDHDLRKACIGAQVNPAVFRRNQLGFLSLPRQMMLYLLPEELVSTLTSKRLGDVGVTCSGLLSGDNARLLRFHWEVSWETGRFRPYTKGGEFCRWLGNLQHAIRWDKCSEAVFSESVTTRLAGLSRYFTEGLTWSDLAGLGLSVRFLPPGFIFDQKGPALFLPSRRETFAYLAFLNSSFARFLAHVFNPSLQIKCGDIQAMPAITDDDLIEKLALLGELCVDLQTRVTVADPSEWVFDGSSCRHEPKSIAAVLAVLHTVEASIDAIIFRQLGASEELVSLVYEEVGCPAAVRICAEFENKLAAASRSAEASEERLRELQINSDSVSRLVPDPDAIPFTAGPSGSWMERLAFSRGFHPLDVFCRLDSDMKGEFRSVCVEVEQNRVVCIVLRMLGHRWPKQIEAGEPVPGWADPDGIIPLTEGEGERRCWSVWS